MNADAVPPTLSLEGAIERDGFAFMRGETMRALIAQAGSLADWEAFTASWEGMPVDTYMADGGRYRRRQHAVFAALPGGAIRREPHQPHYQAPEYNPLHGGIERWFEPVSEAIGNSASLATVLSFSRALFERLAPATGAWRIEVHQFRIEARPGEAGKPTPEGRHRDGVDYVLVLLIGRQNIRRGTTTIHGLDGRILGSFTLADPFDAALVHDARVFHGVTPVVPRVPAAPAHRDVLVVTFRKA